MKSFRCQKPVEFLFFFRFTGKGSVGGKSSKQSKKSTDSDPASDEATAGTSAPQVLAERQSPAAKQTHLI